MNNLPKGFREPHRALGVDNSSPVLVALSGGADSAALLHMMCVCRDSLNFRLYAAHINHNIRTDKYNNEALRDESFCKETCQRLGVELFVLDADIPKLAEQRGGSTETVAREVRYNFFAQIMREHGIKILLTAHNANDNLETQIFNLCRGCGVQGMVGIPQTRDFPEADGKIFRPLLNMTKSEIYGYCQENGVEYVTDSTNFEDEYTRNRIRSKIIPELDEIFGNPCAASARLSQSAAEDSDYILSEAQKIFELHGGKIPLAELNGLHISLRRRLLQMTYDSVSSASLEAVHINALVELAQKAVPHSSISLPDRTTASVEDGFILFEKDKKTVSTDYCIGLSMGLNAIPDTDFAILVAENEQTDEVLKIDGQIYKLDTFARLKNATILSLFARTRREGDTIRTGGMTKKVKKLLCDKRIPLRERDSLPIITCDGEIIYIPRCAVRDENLAKKSFSLVISIYKRQNT